MFLGVKFFMMDKKLVSCFARLATITSLRFRFRSFQSAILFSNSKSFGLHDSYCSSFNKIKSLHEVAGGSSGKLLMFSFSEIKYKDISKMSAGNSAVESLI